jgi:hypothetical protein
MSPEASAMRASCAISRGSSRKRASPCCTKSFARERRPSYAMRSEAMSHAAGSVACPPSISSIAAAWRSSAPIAPYRRYARGAALGRLRGGVVCQPGRWKVVTLHAAWRVGDDELAGACPRIACACSFLPTVTLPGRLRTDCPTYRGRRAVLETSTSQSVPGRPCRRRLEVEVRRRAVGLRPAPALLQPEDRRILGRRGSRLDLQQRLFGEAHLCAVAEKQPHAAVGAGPHVVAREELLPRERGLPRTRFSRAALALALHAHHLGRAFGRLGTRAARGQQADGGGPQKRRSHRHASLAPHRGDISRKTHGPGLVLGYHEPSSLGQVDVLLALRHPRPSSPAS